MPVSYFKHHSHEHLACNLLVGITTTLPDDPIVNGLGDGTSQEYLEFLEREIPIAVLVYQIEGLFEMSSFD